MYGNSNIGIQLINKSGGHYFSKIEVNPNFFTRSNKGTLEYLLKLVIEDKVDYQVVFLLKKFKEVNVFLEIFSIEKSSNLIDTCSFSNGYYVISEILDLSSTEDKENLLFHVIYNMWVIDFNNKKVFYQTLNTKEKLTNHNYDEDDNFKKGDFIIRFSPNITNLKEISLLDEKTNNIVFSLPISGNDIQEDKPTQQSLF